MSLPTTEANDNEARLHPHDGRMQTRLRAYPTAHTPKSLISSHLRLLGGVSFISHTIPLPAVIRATLIPYMWVNVSMDTHFLVISVCKDTKKNVNDK